MLPSSYLHVLLSCLPTVMQWEMSINFAIGPPGKLKTPPSFVQFPTARIIQLHGQKCTDPTGTLSPSQGLDVQSTIPTRLETWYIAEPRSHQDWTHDLYWVKRPMYVRVRTPRPLCLLSKKDRTGWRKMDLSSQTGNIQHDSCGISGSWSQEYTGPQSGVETRRKKKPPEKNLN